APDTRTLRPPGESTRGQHDASRPTSHLHIPAFLLPFLRSSRGQRHVSSTKEPRRPRDELLSHGAHSTTKPKWRRSRTASALDLHPGVSRVLTRPRKRRLR